MACEYCKGKKAIFKRDNEEIVINYRNELVAHLYGYDWVFARASINFCPMCGRDLRGDE